MEVLLKSTTTIKPSIKVFDLSNDIDTQPSPVTLAEVHKMSEYSKVTTVVKVLSKGEPVKLQSGKTKQEVVVADSSGAMIVTLWEEKLDILVVSKSYKLTDFMIRDFNMTKNLTLRRQGSNIEEVADIGPVQENTEHIKLAQSNHIFNADIVAVKQLETFSACVSCKGRVEPLTPPGGRCSRKDCGMFQRIDKCSTQVSAQLFITHGDADKKSIYLWAFGPTFCKLAGNIPPDEVSARHLILRPTFDIINFENNVYWIHSQ